MVVCAMADSQVANAAATITKRAEKNFIAGQINGPRFRRGLSLQCAGEEVEHYSRARRSAARDSCLVARFPAVARRATAQNPASVTSAAGRYVNCLLALMRFVASSISKTASP